MALQRIERLPDRFKVVFQNNAGERVRVWITEEEYLRKDFNQYIVENYAPTGPSWRSYRFWPVPYIYTFDTPTKDLRDGEIWEGVDRHGVDRIVWKTIGKEQGFERADDVVMTLNGDVIESVEKKSR